MKLLTIASNYPYASYPYAGVFNEKCVISLKNMCDHIELIVPSPYIPPFLSINSKLKILNQIYGFEIRNGVAVHRLPIFWLPKFGAAFWADTCAYWCVRQHIKKLHAVNKFDAILSFNLYGGGNLAWRIGRDLGIPACGWAFGSEVRFPKSSAVGKVVNRTIKNLALIFYQSQELREISSRLINETPEKLSANKHVVLPHGIPIPQLTSKEELREKTRKSWGLKDDEIAVLNVGRITKAKGILELLEAISIAASVNSKICCIIVGAIPALDESSVIREKLNSDPILTKSVQILPACAPDEILEILCGADIFVQPSHHEGMPNSLLEAMAVGLPGIAFEIPAIKELDKNGDVLIKVQPFDSKLFADAILKLASDSEQRAILGLKGRKHIIKNFDIRNQMTSAISKIEKIINV